MKNKRFVKYLTGTITLILAVAFVIKFSGPRILRLYISSSIGDCKTVPILCMQPDEKVFTPEINSEYLATLIPQVFPRMSVSVPKGFTLVQELIKKTYYKKRHPKHKAVINLLPQAPGDFIRLYPDVRKQGINDNREFIRRLMNANLNTISNITDAFFVIMKSVFTPDIGSQKIAKMIKFKIKDKSGFINYTMAKPDNYFDCNIFDSEGTFFKIYIKDPGSRLDLNNVFAIISTVKSINN